MSLALARPILIRLGWDHLATGATTNMVTQAVKHFQQGYNIGPELAADGKPGPITMRALLQADGRRTAGLPTASAHFSFTEFRCKGGKADPGCARIWVQRSLLRSLEEYRVGLGRGVSIVSGCRCNVHNERVKGASASRHKAGDAADFAPLRSVSWHRQHDDFDGLGYDAGSGLVRHGDQGGRRTWKYGK